MSLTSSAPTLTPQGTPDAKVWENCSMLLDEWSGGKITTKMYSSGTITTTGTPQTMADGLIEPLLEGLTEPIPQRPE